MDVVFMIIGGVVGFFVLLTFIYKSLGIVVISQNEVGIITKKMASKNLPAGKMIALNGEAGVQADTLAPGWHLWFWPWQYSIEKAKVIAIEPGKIGLVSTIDGETVPASRILARAVDCNNFQDARKFLNNGGQKGKQMAVLTAGQYRINTALFKVSPTIVTKIENDHIGIVTALDGEPLATGEIAAPVVAGHDSFQSIQKFLDAGGKRGTQEQVILPGQWNLNPWFVEVEEHELTEIDIGHVGVVTSWVGAQPVDISGDNFKHGDLVEQGHKGVWEKALSQGKYPINPKTTKVDIVPTTNLVLNWATGKNEAHEMDKNLSSITVRSFDGFSFSLDVSVIIHVGDKKASRVICRMGSMANLISQVLEPAIANYFRNAAQAVPALDFLKKRTEIQTEAAKFVKEALADYDVEAVDTLIGDMVLPTNLLETQTLRKIAEEMQSTYKVQQDSQKEREALERQTAITDSQKLVVTSEQEVKIADMKAQQMVKQAEGQTRVNEQVAQQKLRIAGAEADALRLKAGAEAAQIEAVAKAEASGIQAKGAATAAAYKAAADALGASNFTMLETFSSLGKDKVKIIPDLVVNGGGSDQKGGSGLIDVLLAQLVKDKMVKTDKG